MKDAFEAFILNDRSQLVALGNILELSVQSSRSSTPTELLSEPWPQARRTLGSSKRFMDGVSCTVCSWMGGVS